MNQILLISFFGVLGVLSRFGVDVLLKNSNATFAVSTFFVNTSGCLMAGFLAAFTIYKQTPSNSALLTALLVGFCGGFTTFSALALQALQLIHKDKSLLAFAYLLGSCVLGLCAAAAAFWLTKKVIQ